MVRSTCNNDDKNDSTNSNSNNDNINGSSSSSNNNNNNNSNSPFMGRTRYGSNKNRYIASNNRSNAFTGCSNKIRNNPCTGYWASCRSRWRSRLWLSRGSNAVAL